MSGIPHKTTDGSKKVFVDTSCITPLPTSQLLNRYGVQHDPHCLDNLLKNNRNDTDYWHKFTVSNESLLSEYPKNFVLKVITDFVYPCDLLPVHVSQKATKTFFLARNCLQAILKLCKAGLVVPNPNKPESPFTIIIIKDVLKLDQVPSVNVEENILKVLLRRYSISNNVLDLSRFHEDPGLKEFCSLAQPKLLLYVLNLSNKLEDKIIQGVSNKVVKVILSHNDIKHLPNFQSLQNRRFNSFDLSHNKIQNIENIIPLKDLPNLIAVQLDGNPLCCRFDSGITYFLYVRSICKNLTTLDNHKLFEDGLYKKHRTFLCDTKGFDFANQFLEQYFTHYDKLDRRDIESFYSENAMFSMTYRNLPNQDFVYQTNWRNKQFQIRNRNIKDAIIKPQLEHRLFWGKDNVVAQLISLPVVRHHHPSFCVDLMAYSKTQAIIYVTGVFKHVSAGVIYGVTMGFTRNFILSSDNGKEWIITNDQLFVYAPYNYPQNLETWPEQTGPSLFPDSNYDPSHMNALTITFETITGLAFEHSKKFLEKNNWNMELALKVFMDEHINDEIPDEAFNEESEQEQIELSDDDAVIITEDDILPPIETLLITNPNPSKKPVKSSSTETKQDRTRASRFPKPLPIQPTNSTEVSGSNQYFKQSAVTQSESQNQFKTQDTNMFWRKMRESIPDPNSSSNCSLTIDPTYSLVPHSSRFQNPINPSAFANPDICNCSPLPVDVPNPSATSFLLPHSYNFQNAALSAFSMPIIHSSSPLALSVSDPSSSLRNPLTTLPIQNPGPSIFSVPETHSTFPSFQSEELKAPSTLPQRPKKIQNLKPQPESTNLSLINFPLNSTSHNTLNCDQELAAPSTLLSFEAPLTEEEKLAKFLVLKSKIDGLMMSQDTPTICPSSLPNFTFDTMQPCKKSSEKKEMAKLIMTQPTSSVLPPTLSLEGTKVLFTSPQSSEMLLRKERESTQPVVPLSESTSLPLSSFQNTSTETVKKLEEPEIHSFFPLSKLSAEEKEELAKQLMFQPYSLYRSPELTTRLAALRPPGNPTKRYRIRLRTRTGEIINVTLPRPDHLNGTLLLSTSEEPEVPSSPESTPLPTFPTPEEDFPITTAPPPPLIFQTALTDSFEMSKKPATSSQLFKICLEGKEMSKQPMPQPNDTFFPPSSQHCTEISTKLKGSLVRNKMTSEEEEEGDLAEQVMLEPNPSCWSLELRKRLSALRPPGMKRKRYRVRLRTRTGSFIRVSLPLSEEFPVTTLLPTMPIPEETEIPSPPKSTPLPIFPNPRDDSPIFTTTTLSPPLFSQSASLTDSFEMSEKRTTLSQPFKIPLEEKDISKQVIPQDLSKPVINTDVLDRTVPTSDSFENVTTNTLPKFESPNKVLPIVQPYKLLPEEEDELAKLVMRQPKSGDWSPALRARLAALRPPGCKRNLYRHRLRTLEGKTVRFYIPKKLLLPTSTALLPSSLSESSLTDSFSLDRLDLPLTLLKPSQISSVVNKELAKVMMIQPKHTSPPPFPYP